MPLRAPVTLGRIGVFARQWVLFFSNLFVLVVGVIVPRCHWKECTGLLFNRDKSKVFSPSQLVVTLAFSFSLVRNLF
eukprot:gene9354-6577_t